MTRTPQQPGRSVGMNLADRQVQMLYRNTPMTLAFSFFGTAMSLAVLYDIGDMARGLFWFAFATGALLFRGSLAWFYLQESFKLSASTWARLMMAGNFLAGVQWGLLGTWLFPIAPNYAQLFIIMVIPSYVAGSIVTFASVRFVHLALAIPAVIPAVIYIFYVYAGQPLACAMGLFFFGTVCYFAHRQYGIVAQRLQIEIDNETNARRLTDSNSAMGQHYDELKHRAEVIKRSQVEARRRARVLAAHVENTLLPVIEFDDRYRVIEANQAALESLGVSDSGARNRDIGEFFIAADLLETAVQAAARSMASAHPLAISAFLVGSDQQRHPVQLYFTPICMDPGTPSRLAVIVTDAPTVLHQRRLAKNGMHGSA